MHDALSSQAKPGADHVALAASGASAALSLALASAEVGEVAFGAGLEIALAFVDGNAVAPEWIQVFPKGPEIVARDGRRWTLPDPQAVLDAFARNRADLPADINHATEILGPRGEEAPAYGWIKEFALRDGLVMARVDWTAEGAGLIAGRKYRYVSPAFKHTPDGRIAAVKSIALVTHPALDMPALAHLQPNPPKEASMSLLARLIAACGLSVTASEDQVYDHVTGQVALAREARDPTKLVPKADLDTALARATTAEAALATIQEQGQDEAATAAVDAAIAIGKIAPASKDHWVSIAREQPEVFKSVVDSMPATLTPPSDTNKDPSAAKTGVEGLTEQQLGLCRDLGLDPVAYAAELKDRAQ